MTAALSAGNESSFGNGGQARFLRAANAKVLFLAAGAENIFRFEGSRLPAKKEKIKFEIRSIGW